MKLHEFPSEFRDLISIVAKDKHLPESAIERDYYIVLLLKNLADSEYIEKCVFKGGTSLSKCYQRKWFYHNINRLRDFEIKIVKSQRNNQNNG